MLETIRKKLLSLLALSVLLPTTALLAQPPAQDAVTLVDVRKIWDRAPHNAFTDLIRFQDRWYCVFREGDGHVSPHGRIRVIESADGKSWQSAALIERPGADLRDAKITVTPDGQLMLSGAAALPASATHRHQSLSWFSDDGRDWSEGFPVGDPDVWLWRVTWHGPRAYGIGYGTADSRGTLRLYQSEDGKSFQPLVADLRKNSFGNESSILFRKDDTAECLLRRDGAENSALLGTSKPPYREWNWRDLGVRVGGPHLIEIPDGRVLAAVRLYDGGARTSLCWLDTARATLTECLELPSGGDTSYAGLVWHDDHLWVSYYSGHEADASHATTSIYLAKVKVPLSDK
ncbi:exo-alpha-sialidase [Roseiconus nitratireducens]|uniref:Exo-alpha-sialidase n=2 Tax=Roseiconus nitratireducens TaxID=2605748 RepID=A0A5M6D3M9_9BACT|nr:exo-alpha-sialidase [Roseiconus nitratireducens]